MAGTEKGRLEIRSREFFIYFWRASYLFVCRAEDPSSSTSHIIIIRIDMNGHCTYIRTHGYVGWFLGAAQQTCSQDRTAYLRN